MATNPPQLFLLADHIKLSLLERQRAISLNLPSTSQDAQISRSLEQLRSGIESLESQVEDTADEYVTLPQHLTYIILTTLDQYPPNSHA
jgi:syntaxin 8